jgi:hypothetical protein
MAIVSLKNVTVTRLNVTGTGFSVLEESRDKKYKSYYKIWAEGSHGFVVGDVISVSGLLSVKVGDPKTGSDGVERRYAEVGVNSPRFERSGDAHVPAAVERVDEWNMPDPQHADEVPF